MAKFYVTIKSSSYYTITVEADSKDDALTAFDWNDIDWSDPQHIESDISEVEQIKEAEHEAI